jgi:hypothetical protein
MYNVTMYDVTMYDVTMYDVTIFDVTMFDITMFDVAIYDVAIYDVTMYYVTMYYVTIYDVMIFTIAKLVDKTLSISEFVWSFITSKSQTFGNDLKNLHTYQLIVIHVFRLCFLQLHSNRFSDQIVKSKYLSTIELRI